MSGHDENRKSANDWQASFSAIPFFRKKATCKFVLLDRFDTSFLSQILRWGQVIALGKVLDDKGLLSMTLFRSAIDMCQFVTKAPKSSLALLNSLEVPGAGSPKDWLLMETIKGLST